jgi:hypothetical protein
LNSSKNKRLYVAHTFVATVIYEQSIPIYP